MPMLVGEVRWAMTAVGCSCRLSGGSQLSAGPTCWSKNAQVLRANPRKKRSSAGVGANAARDDGRLSHQAMAGLASQSSRNGPARACATGVCSSRAHSARASAGAIHISRYSPGRSLLLVRSTSREGFHCSRRRLLNSMRHSVRAMASRLYSAS
ncbi:hypothetical protein D9M69_395680 [compost metagenome]